MKKHILQIDKGILFMLVSALFSAFLNGFSKTVSQIIPALEVTLFSNVFGVIIIGISLYKTPAREIGGKPFLLFSRGAMGFGAFLLYFYTIANIPLGEAVTYNRASPIFVAIFAYFFLKEKLSKVTIFAIILGFIGIVFIAQPQGTEFNRYDALGILSGVMAGLAYTSIRGLRKYYDSREIVMSFVLVGTILPLILMIITPYITIPKGFDFIFSTFILPQGMEWFYLIMIGVFSTFSQFFMTKAYEHTKAGVIGAVSYLNIVFAIFIGIALGDKFPTTVVVLGIIFVIVSGLLVAFEKEDKK